MELPAQAIPSRLTQLCPTGETWSVQAVRSFTQLVSQRVIMARVTSIGHAVSVCLCDVSAAEDVHVNDVLVKSELAKQCDDTEVRRLHVNVY